MRKRDRTGVGAVERDPESAVVGDGDGVVTVGKMKIEILASAVVEVGWEAQLECDGAGAVGFQAGGDVADTIDFFRAEPAWGVVGYAGGRHGERRNAHGIAFKEIALESERSGCGENVIG